MDFSVDYNVYIGLPILFHSFNSLVLQESFASLVTIALGPLFTFGYALSL